MNTHPSHSHREALPTGHAVLYLVIFCPLPVQGLRVFDLRKQNMSSITSHTICQSQYKAGVLKLQPVSQMWPVEP